MPSALSYQQAIGPVTLNNACTRYKPSTSQKCQASNSIVFRRYRIGNRREFRCVFGRGTAESTSFAAQKAAEAALAKLTEFGISVVKGFCNTT
ncbi:768_t:CDS:2 [Paraglomus brasilianum]|uniref:768_t:CDS:1 n=1 Tax=Paraglomus brasilianum TaxID=144538 RepID=A0A9N9BGM2_9GLOM|nr:768_t:CDS:2 [Paraglomus brasilianum]